MRIVLALTAALVLGSSVAAGAVDVEPSRSDLAAEAGALIQEARNGSDPTAQDRAEALYLEILSGDPVNADALVGLGTIAMARHRFADALELGQQAREAAPASSRPLGVVVDALIEMGRYDEARDALQAMLLARPDLASFTRLSYYHELHGDIDLAIDAMESAVVAGGPAVENTEFARVKLGDLWLLEDEPDRAAGLYETTLELLPEYVPALHGMAKVALAGDDIAAAERHLLKAISVAALPESLVQLGALQEAAGEPELAAATYATAVAMERFHRDSSGVPEPFGALLEATYGDSALALDIAREVHAETPSIGAADALAWALYITGDTDEALERATEALRTGTKDPSIRYHAGLIATEAGDARQGQIWLEEAQTAASAGPALLRSEIEAALAAG